MYNFSILGATGVLGKATSTLLLQHGFKIKALIRNPHKEQELTEKGIHVLVGENNSETLRQLCTDTEVVLAAFHGMLGKGKSRSELVDDKAHCDLIDAAKEMGVQQFIYVSAAGAAQDNPIDFFRTKYKVEQYLVASGLTYTILRPAAFMEWHMHNLLGKGIVNKGKTIIMGKGENPTNYIAAADIAQLVKLAYKNESFYNKIIELAGPDNLTKKEVVDLYANKLNIVPKITHLPRGLLNVLSATFKPFHPGISRIMKVSVIGDTVPAIMDSKLTVERFGLQPTTAEKFVEKIVSQKDS